MTSSELHFTNPASLILASSILGADLKRAKFVRFVENERFFADGNRDSQKTSLISSKVAEALGIDFGVIEQEEHLANPAKIIESNLKRDFFPSGQTLIMYGGDNYCRFGFRNYVNFPYTKYRLKNSWNEIDFPVEDLLYGYNIKDYKKNSRTIQNTFNLNILELKKIARSLNEKLEFDFTNSHKISTQKKYLLAMPYRHDRISEEFSSNFFSSVKDIAWKMNLGVIVKSHPNDIYNYRDYFSDQEEFFFHQDISERHIPVEFFLQSEQIKYTVGVPSSSLPFAELERLSVHVPKNRDLFRRKFLDQIPFLERLSIPVTYI
jgi:hypothetical protein